jgi:RNA polymerase sigma-70 factor (ECF subfamily)
MTSCYTGAASIMEAHSHGDVVAEDWLVEQSRSGDLNAFDRLVERHYAGVYAVARRLSPSPDDAADVAQEVFLAAWKQIRGFHRRASFRTWLHAICVRQCALSVRAIRNRPASFDDREASLPEPVDPDAPSLESLFERREREEALHAAIHTLPRAQREAVVLHYFGNLTCAETAAVMGISAGAVMTHLFRARQSLRGSLRWLADEEASR